MQTPDARLLSERLAVTRNGTSLLRVACWDREATTAIAATNAVTNAFTDLYREQEAQVERQRVGVMEDHVQFMRAGLTSCRPRSTA